MNRINLRKLLNWDGNTLACLIVLAVYIAAGLALTLVVTVVPWLLR